MNRAWNGAVALVLAGALACHEANKPTAPGGPGVLELMLNTPNANDGAVLVDVSGVVDSVQAAGFTTFSALETGGVRVVVTGNLARGVIARLFVPDVTEADQYIATLFEAAQRTTFGLQDLTGYSLSVQPAP